MYLCILRLHTGYFSPTSFALVNHDGLLGSPLISSPQTSPLTTMSDSELISSIHRLGRTELNLKIGRS